MEESGYLKTCYLKIIDVLQPEIDALEDQQSLAAETSVNVSVCADTITNRIHEFIEETQIDVMKISCTDGASAMVGHHNGVVAQLKQSTPSANDVHCASTWHRHKLVIL